jgi:hypothetical protein
VADGPATRPTCEERLASAEPGGSKRETVLGGVNRAAAMEAQLTRGQNSVNDRAAALVRAREATHQSRLAAEKLRRHLERHTFGHRVDEILRLVDQLDRPPSEPLSTAPSRASVGATTDHGSA